MGKIIQKWMNSSLTAKMGATLIFILVALTVMGIFIGRSFAWWDISQFGLNQYTKNPAEVFRNIIWSFGLLFGGIFALLGFANALHRTQQKDTDIIQKVAELAHGKEKSSDERYAKRRQIDSEIFSQSVEQLGHEKQAVRLGGLYAIENLARTAIKRTRTENNKAYLNSLLETLSAYVRVQAPIPNKENRAPNDKVAIDVEAAIRIISRTFSYAIRQGINADSVNLNNTFLPQLVMPENSDMRKFNLKGVVLQNATLTAVNLEQSNLSHTNLFTTLL